MKPRNHASFHSIYVSRERVGQRGETGNEREKGEDGEVIVLDTLRDGGN